MSMNNLTGQTIAGYEVREILGMGGAATVYRAFQPTIGRYVALKLLSARLVNKPDFAEQLDREMRIIARFEHPHVIPTYDNNSNDASTARELLQRMKRPPELIAAVDKKVDSLLNSGKRGFSLFSRRRD